jgi:hypothetical protein
MLVCGIQVVSGLGVEKQSYSTGSKMWNVSHRHGSLVNNSVQDFQGLFVGLSSITFTSLPQFP